jgi:hypothetical protein
LLAAAVEAAAAVAGCRVPACTACTTCIGKMYSVDYVVCNGDTQQVSSKRHTGAVRQTVRLQVQMICMETSPGCAVALAPVLLLPTCCPSALPLAARTATSCAIRFMFAPCTECEYGSIKACLLSTIRVWQSMLLPLLVIVVWWCCCCCGSG